MTMAAIGAAVLLVPGGVRSDTSQTCRAEFEIVTNDVHGTLPAGTVLTGEMTYAEGRSMKMGSETMSYLSNGSMIVTAKDGTRIEAALRAIHLVRTPHFADYASFDAKDVVGDLGGVIDYEDPMLLTFYAPRGSLKSFDLPTSTAGWQALSKRRDFQVHTPDTMETLPGEISAFQVTCG
ncbi:MAG: hypothetical protein AAFV19_10090 [Pseudomonadota bacterium]